METASSTGENPILPDPPARVPRFEDLKLRQPPQPSAVPQYSAELVLAAIRECMFVVRPGDTLVVRVPPYIQQERVDAYRERVAGMLGDKPYEVLFVTGDEFAVMTTRPEEAPVPETAGEPVTDPIAKLAREFGLVRRLPQNAGLPQFPMVIGPDWPVPAPGPAREFTELQDRPEAPAEDEKLPETPEKAEEG